MVFKASEHTQCEKRGLQTEPWKSPIFRRWAKKEELTKKTDKEHPSRQAASWMVQYQWSQVKKCFKNDGSSNFPGGPVVKNPPANTRTWVWFLVQEDPTGCRATKPVYPNHWTHELQVLSPCTWSLSFTARSHHTAVRGPSTTVKGQASLTTTRDSRRTAARLSGAKNTFSKMMSSTLLSHLVTWKM